MKVDQEKISIKSSFSTKMQEPTEPSYKQEPNLDCNVNHREQLLECLRVFQWSGGKGEELCLNFTSSVFYFSNEFRISFLEIALIILFPCNISHHFIKVTLSYPLVPTFSGLAISDTKRLLYHTLICAFIRFIKCIWYSRPT